MSEFRVVTALLPLLRAHVGSVLLLVALGALAGFCEGIGISMLLPLLTGLGEADPAAGGPLGRWLGALFAGVAPESRLQVVLGAMFALIAGKAVLTAANGLLFARLDARLVDELRRKVLGQVLRVRVGYVEQRRTGELLALLQSQTWETSGALARLVGIAIRLLTIAVFGLALMLISWRLTLAVLAALLAISWVVRRVSRRADRLSEVAMREWNGLMQRCVELLRGLRTTRAFGREAYEQQRFARQSAGTSSAFQRIDRLRALVEPMSELLVALLLAGVLLASLREPGRLPALLTFLLILFRLQPQVQRLDSARVALASAAAPVRAVTEFLDESDKPYLPNGSVPFHGLRTAIRFDDVTFHYDRQDPAHAALVGVDATIPARQTTAIVGPSGAGKSTLVHLLLRFADPTHGRIWIDDVPLPELDLASWLANVALVGQDAHLFHASVADNIRYGRLDASADAIVAAARRAHADEFIRTLPAGYDTLLGEDGVQLSGGQRQRIALARALVRDGGILVLDEATNALDPIAERLVQDALAELAGERTILVIAHRMTTIARADHVLVFDRGRIVEQGDRSALLAGGALFARLHALQLGGAR